MGDDSLRHLDQRRPRGRRYALSVAALALGLLSGCERLKAEAASRMPAESAAPAAPTRADIEREVARRLPDLALTFAAPDSDAAAAPYEVLRFTYETPPGPRRRVHGNGLALWRVGDWLPRWYLVRPGDLAPHSLFWTDANRDGRADLLFLAGAGDTRATFVYVDRGARDAFTDSAFALAYTSASEYATLVDLDADGTAEIIDAGRRRRGNASAPGCAELELPARLRAPVAREYRRLAGEFDDANFKFALTEDELENGETRARYAFDALYLLHPVKIFAVLGARAVDLTPEFPDHLRWRIEILKELRKDLRAPKQRRCRNTVDGVIKHLRRDVARARRGPWTPPGS